MFIVLGVPLTAQRGGGPYRPRPADLRIPSKASRPQSQRAAQIYNKACTVCHGLDGAAEKWGPRSARGAPQRDAKRAEIFDVIKNGIPATGMPPFAGSDDDDIWKVTAYIQALRGTAIDAPMPATSPSGEASSGARRNAASATW